MVTPTIAEEIRQAWACRGVSSLPSPSLYPLRVLSSRVGVILHQRVAVSAPALSLAVDLRRVRASTPAHTRNCQNRSTTWIAPPGRRLLRRSFCVRAGTPAHPGKNQRPRASSAPAQSSCLVESSPTHRSFLRQISRCVLA